MEHPWVSPEDVRDLAASLKRGTTGVIVTPGAFSPAARDTAEERGIERVSGVDLLRMIWQLSPAEQEYLLQMATAGEYRRPTCPCCHQKLILGKYPETDSRASAGKTKVYRLSGTVNHEVQFGTIIVKKYAKVTFLRPVKAQRLEIYGYASGNFTVDGPVKIAPSRGELS